MKLPEKTKRKETETPISRKCREAVARAFTDVRLARNNNGTITDARGIPITFGLGNGSPDLVGVVTFWLDGFPVALAFGLEVKQPGRYATRTQRAWHAVAKRRGLLVSVVTSPEEAVAAVTKIREEYARRLALRGAA